MTPQKIPYDDPANAKQSPANESGRCKLLNDDPANDERQTELRGLEKGLEKTMDRVDGAAVGRYERTYRARQILLSYNAFRDIRSGELAAWHDLMSCRSVDAVTSWIWGCGGRGFRGVFSLVSCSKLAIFATLGFWPPTCVEFNDVVSSAATRSDTSIGVHQLQRHCTTDLLLSSMSLQFHV